MDSCRSEAPSNEAIYALLLELKAEIIEAKRPTQRKNRAAWRDRMPELEAMVIEKGYARSADAEQLGLNNTEWGRCTADLIKAHPEWRTENAKHRKVLFRPDFDVHLVELDVLTYENYLSNDPKVLGHMADRILRTGRLNVLDDLQTHHPRTGELWREGFLGNLTDYIRERGLPIEREKVMDRGVPRSTDWFKRR